MLDRFQQELQEIKEQLVYKKKWQERLEKLEDEEKLQQVKMHKLKAVLDKEQKDVDRLKTLSVPAILYALIGRKLEKLDKEEQEAVTAQLKYQEACRTMADLQEDIAALRGKLATVADADQRYEEWLSRKEALIHDSGSPLSARLYALMDREAGIRAALKEYDEAVAAGRQAKHALGQALKSLGKAKDWSGWDVLGGGVLTTAVKHNKIDEAQGDIHEAQQALRNFQTELGDVTNEALDELADDRLLTFADYFFDNIVTDWTVHSKIQDSERQTKEVLHEINGLLRRLNEKMTGLKAQYAAIGRKRTELIQEGR